MPPDSLFGQDVKADARDAAGSTDEAGADNVLVQPDCLKNLGPLVRRQGRDTHFAHHLEHALGHRLPEGRHDLLIAELVFEHSVEPSLPQRLEGQVGVDGISAVAGEQAEVVHLAGLTRFEHDADAGP